MDECQHGDYPDTCPPCRRAAGKSNGESPPPEIEFSFLARYDGDCRSCHTPIIVGQPAAKWTDGVTRHQGCRP